MLEGGLLNVALTPNRNGVNPAARFDTGRDVP
jgi:hypothetical protein